MKKLIFFIVLISVQCSVKAQDTIMVKSVEQAIFEADKGNYLNLIIYNDKSTSFPENFKQIPKNKLLGLMFDNCSYTSFPSYLGEYKSLIRFGYVWYFMDSAPINEIPKFVYQLENLEFLVFEYVKISKVDAKIRALKKLQMLSLYSCKLDEFPTEILELDQLERLDLSCNNFSTIPTEITRLRKLKSLNFDGGGCGATPIASLPENIGDLKKLNYLGLGYTKTPIKELPASFYELENLQTFTCHGCGLESLSEDIGNLKNLKKISLTNLNHFNALPNSFFELPNLESFRFYATDIQTKDLLIQKKAIDTWGENIKSYNFEVNTQNENLYRYLNN